MQFEFDQVKLKFKENLIEVEVIFKIFFSDSVCIEIHKWRTEAIPQVTSHNFVLHRGTAVGKY